MATDAQDVVDDSSRLFYIDPRTVQVAQLDGTTYSCGSVTMLLPNSFTNGGSTGTPFIRIDAKNVVSLQVAPKCARLSST